MALEFVNSSDYRVNVATYTALSYTDIDSPVWADFSGTTYTKVPNITGIAISDDGSYKDVTDLGSYAWMKNVREKLGITISLTLEYLLDDADDSLEAGHEILAGASKKVGLGSLVLVRFDHPKAAHSANEATDGVPTSGDVTVGAFNVQGGSLGLGSGGANGAFVTTAYDLKSYGLVSTVTVA